MEPGQKIIDFIKARPEVKQRIVQERQEKPYQAIILKDSTGAIIPFDETPTTLQMRENLQFINERLASYDIELLLDEDRQIILEQVHKARYPRHRLVEFEDLPFFNTSRIKLYRVFNDSTFDHGGRFFGHWVQGIFSKDYPFRRHLLLNDQGTIELDFSALHPYMSWQLSGNSQPPEGDLYQVPIKNYKENRPLVKTVFNAMLNATGSSAQAARNKVAASCTKKVSGGYFDKSTRLFVNEIIDHFY